MGQSHFAKDKVEFVVHLNGILGLHYLRVKFVSNDFGAGFM
jgi:hypothetical protein